MVVLIFLGILLFMYFRNSRREGYYGGGYYNTANAARQKAQNKNECDKAKGKWNKNKCT